MKLHITQYGTVTVGGPRSRYESSVYQVETESGEVVLKEFASGRSTTFLTGPGLAEIDDLKEVEYDVYDEDTADEDGVIPDDEEPISPLRSVGYGDVNVVSAFVAGWEAAIAHSGPESPARLVSFL